MSVGSVLPPQIQLNNLSRKMRYYLCFAPFMSPNIPPPVGQLLGRMFFERMPRTICRRKHSRSQGKTEHLVRNTFIVLLTTLSQIRPRCHYCRNNTPCPSLECSRCTNRIIVPDPYRTSQDRRLFVCPACDNSATKVATIISQETTTRALNNENGIAWLGFSISDDVFEGKSAFKLMQLHGVGIFGEQPAASSTLKLSLNGKKVQDPAQAFAQIERRVGRGEVELGSCALCFEEILKTKLVPACGRTGCGQKVDEGCLHEWVSFTFFSVAYNNYILSNDSMGKTNRASC
jgi:hypothetical protein